MASTIPTAAMLATSFFTGAQLSPLRSDSVRVMARFGIGTKKGTASKGTTKKTTRKSKSGPNSDRPLWYPGATAPEWLDGSLVGDYGFDPLGLGKPKEYLQFDFDSLDQNLSKNLPGDVIETRIETADLQPTALQPYTDVFGLQRFRECELIHGRWAMLATLGALTVEWLTGVTWQDAGKVSSKFFQVTKWN